MQTVAFTLNGVQLFLTRKESNKGKNGFVYSGEYVVGDMSLPIVSVSHFLTLLFKFSNLES